MQRATELQDRARSRALGSGYDTIDAPSAPGLTLDVVHDIARQVGLDAQFVEEAVASLSHDRADEGPGLLGGPITYQRGATFPSPLTEAQRLELLDRIRRAQKHQGEVQEVMGALEWKTVGRIDAMTVTIHSTEEEAAVRIFNDRSGVAALTWIASLAGGLTAGGIAVDLLQPDTYLVIASILGAGGAAGLGVARTVWSLVSRKLSRRVDELREDVARYLLR